MIARVRGPASPATGCCAAVDAAARGSGAVPAAVRTSQPAPLIASAATEDHQTRRLCREVRTAGVSLAKAQIVLVARALDQLAGHRVDAGQFVGGPLGAGAAPATQQIGQSRELGGAAEPGRPRAGA